MPLRRLDAPMTTTPAPTQGGLRRLSAVPTPEETDDEGFPVGATLAGGAALTGAALLARNPNAPAALRRGMEYANALRQQSMLSGFAPLKSMLGNVGAVIAQSAETRSLEPLKQLLSMQTVRDALPAGATVGEKLKNAFVTGRSAVAPSAASGVNLPGVLGGPGRVMSALDDATRKALVRSGMTADSAEMATFQAPIGKNYGPFGKVFEDNPVADYIFPFRRTPLNQFAEGLKTLSGPHRDPAVLGTYAGAGAAHGAATSDEQYPVSIPFGVALAAKYGLPYGLAAIAGRVLAGGKGAGNTAGSVLPVSEYGLSESIENPLAPFAEPAALRALKKLSGGR